MSAGPGCERCGDLHVEWAIRTPGELEKAIRVIGGHVDGGDLEEVSVRPGLHALREDGPRPDHIDLFFRCTGCGSRFSLSVETYHGRGGSWRSLTP